MQSSNVTELIASVDRYAIKGFLADDEAAALFALAQDVSHLGASLEIGSYCGKSTVFIGAACKRNNATLFAVDHHRGSEEHQLGEEYHDGDLYNAKREHVDTFPFFRQTLDRFGLEDTVLPIVASSAVTLKNWSAPLSFVFIDGGHSDAMSLADCTGWCQHIVSGGVLAIHDIFESPSDGGQGPYLAMKAVLEQHPFELVDKVNSLAVLRRL